MVRDFRDICKFCNETKLNFLYKDRKITLHGILPDAFCPLAFHSVYPYMVTLLKGGWFNWVGYKEHLVVNCPSSEGIAMYVKASTKGLPNILEVEIKKKNSICYKKYDYKEIFSFNFNHENAIKFKLLATAIPFIINRYRDNTQRNEFACNIDYQKIYCQIEFEK